MKKNFFRAALLSAFLTLAGHAQAAPVTVLYAEGQDLSPNLANPPSVGSLVEGTNTVTGSVSDECSRFGGECRPRGDGGDAFSFLIDDSLRLISATVTITNFEKGGPANTRGRSFTDLMQSAFAGNVTDVNVLPVDEIFGLQSYQFSVGISAVGDVPYYYVEYARYDWQLTLVTELRDPVAAVPLPGTLPLALVAIGSLVWVRVRRKATNDPR